jgi:TPR repeat protein/energy-coupling factor transporter ATP-binding protein EcfA2
MANNMLLPGFRLYQTANATGEEIRDNFIVRLHEFDIIMNDVRRNPMKGSVQHFLLLGRRGSGKSTLLRRIQEEIESDSALQKKFTAINLAEEQADIYRLFDLWEKVLESLKESGMEVEIPQWKENAGYTQELAVAIHKAIAKSKKKVILLLDNIDRVFENLVDEAALLREYLLNHDDIRIIGGSTRMTEEFWQYNQPFYQFFRVLELKPLTSGEVMKLLQHWSKTQELPELEEFIKTKRGQIESIRILTDGLPRTLQFFVSILLDRKEQNSYEYLKQIMDYVTPLYQERLNHLPAPHRKIVLQMAFLWEGVGAKQIAEACRLEAKLVSANLKQLQDKGLVQKLETKTKNHLYRLSERFFNLWLIFTQGSPVEKKRARCLTVFLENFYTIQDIKRLAKEHLNILTAKGIDPNHAAIFTKALAQSKYISLRERDWLINGTLALENIDPQLKQQLPESISSLLKKSMELIDRKGINEAIKLIEEIEQEDGVKYFFLSILYGSAGNKKNSKASLQKAFNVSDLSEMAQFLEYLQGTDDDFFRDLDFNKLLESLYLAASKKGVKDAMYNLGKLYLKQRKFKEAEAILVKISKERNIDGFRFIGSLLANEKMFDEAEKYLLKAIRSGDNDAKTILGDVYFQQKKYHEAEVILQERVNEGDSAAMNKMGELLMLANGNFSKAEKYLKMGAEKGDISCIAKLGLFYWKNNDVKLAETYFLEACEKKSIEAYIYLAIFYYNEAMEKVKSLGLTQKVHPSFPRKLSIQAWNGKLEYLETELILLISDNNNSFLQDEIKQLLVHHQKNLIKKMFHHKEFGASLKEKYLPLYYATELLTGKENNIELRIPPELQETVNDILKYIAERQKVYYPDTNPDSVQLKNN